MSAKKSQGRQKPDSVPFENNHKLSDPHLTNRRDFIRKTLKLTAGSYVAMSVLESFVGPKIGDHGMPLMAASSAGHLNEQRLQRLKQHPGPINDSITIIPMYVPAVSLSVLRINSRRLLVSLP